MIAQIFPGVWFVRSQGFRTFLVLLTLSLGGCGPIMVPRNPPFPYPEGLRAYLSEPWIDREDVHAALGPPALSRMEGDLELYFARREVAVELIVRTRKYDTHYLLVRYRNDRSVLWQSEVVNAGCVPYGICVNRGIDDAASGYGGARDPKLVVLYGDNETNQLAREAERGYHKCIIYPEANDGNQSGFPELSIQLPGHDPVLLPLTGFVVWKGDAQEHQLRVAFRTGGRYEENLFEFDCADAQPTYFRLSAEKSGFFVPSFAIRMERVNAPTGAAAIESKWLILSH